MHVTSEHLRPSGTSLTLIFLLLLLLLPLVSAFLALCEDDAAEVPEVDDETDELFCLVGDAIGEDERSDPTVLDVGI